MLELSRKCAFWILDALNGHIVRDSCKALNRCDKEDFDSNFLSEYQHKHIQNLISHATHTTIFYSHVNKAELGAFPIINKNLIKQQQDAFLSSKFQRESLIQMRTSGSTGTPFISYQDRLKKKKVNAECIYYSQKLGYDVGKNLTYIRGAAQQIRKSKLKQFIQNQPLLYCLNLTDYGIENILNRISSNRNSQKYLITYASTLDAFSDYFKRNGISLTETTKIAGIISGAEMLYDNTRDTISNAFGCKCVSRYSNEENGILGQDDNINNVFLINEAHYYIEVLQMDKDKPAALGEIGRIVVTDFFNYAMPMIRYDTGDIGAIEIVTYNGAKHRAITNFGGRKIDEIFDADNNRISPHAITNALWSFPELRQFQFIQKGSASYLLKLNCNDTFVRKQELLQVFHDLLGASAEIKIEYVAELPVLQSGKRKYIANEIPKVLS